MNKSGNSDDYAYFLLLFFHCSKTCAHSTDIIKLRDCIIINRSDAYHFNYFQTKQHVLVLHGS